jgi:threonine synthase
VKYVSTRGEAPVLDFEDVLLAGLARDGGLYLPESWPSIDSKTIGSFAGRPFPEIAVEIIAPFVGNSIGRDELLQMARRAYSSFGHPAVTPIVQTDTNLFILELFHGPTLAFKDVAMQILAQLMDHVLAKRGERATIVGATSGDTGGAAIEAFRGLDRVDVVILFPDGRVSDVQRRMMTTPVDKNVHALAIKGTFDDCQALVKGMFNDLRFRDRVRLSGVNSINWARIVAQVTYYFAAGAALGAPSRRLSFAVPTGNFGDIFAGFVAKKMGLSIDRLVIASNANDILPRAMETGTYATHEVVATTSPSMDIQVSSNFERALFEASGRDAGMVRAQMGSLAQSGRFALGPAHAALKETFDAVRATERDVAATIRNTLERSGYLADPHTACGIFGAEQVLDRRSAAGVVLATAHPAKFPDAMAEITGRRPGLPPRLDRLMGDPENYDVADNDLGAVQRYVEGKARAVSGGA